MEIRPIDAKYLLENNTIYDVEDEEGDIIDHAISVGDIDDAPTLSLNTLRDAIYQDAVKHGLWDYPKYSRTNPNMMGYVRCACVERVREELTEAVEACDDPVQFAKELTDAAITIFSAFGHLGIDADKLIRETMENNKQRPWKHGKE